jgi:DNA polymerase-4
VTDRAPRSLGHETTFPEDVADREVLRSTLVALVDQVAARLRRHGLKARCLQLKVRYAPFRTITRRRTLDGASGTTGVLLDAALGLLEGLPAGEPPVRLLGVACSHFSGQGLLFGDGGPRLRDLDVAVDAVRDRFGPAALRRGSVLG